MPIVKELTPLLKCIAEPARLRILFILDKECIPVSEVVKRTNLSQTNASFHLRMLRDAGLVNTARKGKFIYYCIEDERLMGIIRSLSAWIKDHNHDLA